MTSVATTGEQCPAALHVSGDRDRYSLEFPDAPGRLDQRDHGGLSNTTPTDGAFEEYTEAFTVSPALLSAGNHTLSIQACNSVGNCSEWLEMLSIPCVFCYYFPLLGR